MARSEAQDSGQVDLVAFHGSPDAPAVDIESGGQVIIPGLEYAEFSDYLSSAPEFIDLTVVPDNGGPGVPFAADLRDLEGQSVTILASGFLDPETVEPFFGLFAVLADGTVLTLPVVGSSNVQVFHNSPSGDVDVYVNGEIVFTQFEYAAATPYVAFPSNVPIEFGIAPYPSDGPSDIVFSEEFVFESNENYFAAANGIIGDDDTPFELAVNSGARLGSTEPGKFDASFFHGAPDAPNVDIETDPPGLAVSDLAYGDFSDYVTLDPGFYTLDVLPAGGDDPVTTLSAPFSQLEDVGVTLVASGFLDPEGDHPEFQVFAVFPSGVVFPLPEYATAQLQVVHNSPSPDVDIYINGELTLEEFAYRSATPYLELPAEVPVNIAIAAAPSSSVDDAFVAFDAELTADEAFILVASGILGDDDAPFSADLFGSVTEAFDPEMVSFFIYHGASDAPPVDAFIRPNFLAAEDLEYRERTGYINAQAGNFPMDLTVSATQELINSYQLEFEDREGMSAMVFVSGMADPDGDQPGLGLFGAFSDGTVVEFGELGAPNVQIIHNSPSPVVDLWLGDEKILEDFEFRTATPYLELPASGEVEIGVAPSPSDSPDDVIATFEIELLPGGNYVAIANGIVGDPDVPFSLEVMDNIIFDVDPDQANVLVFHGAPDVPNVDIGILDLDDEEVFLLDNLSYGEFVGQLGFPALDPAPSEFVRRFGLRGLVGWRAASVEAQ